MLAANGRPGRHAARIALHGTSQPCTGASEGHTRFVVHLFYSLSSYASPHRSFERVGDPKVKTGRYEYAHPSFLQGKPDLLCLVVRKTNQTGKKRLQGKRVALVNSAIQDVCDATYEWLTLGFSPTAPTPITHRSRFWIESICQKARSLADGTCRWPRSIRLAAWRIRRPPCKPAAWPRRHLGSRRHARHVLIFIQCGTAQAF